MVKCIRELCCVLDECYKAELIEVKCLHLGDVSTFIVLIDLRQKGPQSSVTLLA